MTAMLDQAAADPQQIIADLQRKLDARTAELQEKNERYALVSQAVAEGIYDWDIARNALWVSPRLIEIFGWGEPGPDAGARPSQDWNARVHPDDFEHYRAALRAALKGETPRLHCEYRIRLSDGEYRWVEDHALPVRDERGWAVRLVGAVSDVTDRKRQEQELREALDQQTATAEVLRVISGSATDVQPVFEAITARAAKLCEAEFSAVARFEDGLLHLVAVSNLLPDEARAFHSLFPRPPTRGFVMGRAFVEGRTVHIEDVLADPDYDPRTREILQSLTGYRSFFGVPILRDGKPIGVIGCARRAVRPFTTAQIELVTTFADQAVIAIENARLFDDLRQRTDDLQESLEYQTATSDVLNVISRSTADVQPVLDTVVETAARLCGADTGNITIREGEVYRTVSNSSSAEDAEYYATLRQRRFVPGRDSVTGRVALEGRVVHVEDIRRSRTTRCPRVWRPGGARHSGCRCCARELCSARSISRGNGSSRSPSGRSSWCAPLPTRRSSRWRTRGCSVNCRPARATSKNCSNTRQRRATCSRSSAARPPMCNRCWTQWSKRPLGFAATIPQRS